MLAPEFREGHNISWRQFCLKQDKAARKVLRASGWIDPEYEKQKAEDEAKAKAEAEAKAEEEAKRKAEEEQLMAQKDAAMAFLRGFNDALEEHITFVGLARRPTCAEILQEVSIATGFDAVDLLGRCRSRGLIKARHEIFYRCRMETGKSYPMIGKTLGGFDHTTIMHGAISHARKNDLPVPGVEQSYHRVRAGR